MQFICINKAETVNEKAERGNLKEDFGGGGGGGDSGSCGVQWQ